jgi:DNA-directed RNA polymerase specialized sigma24 family protein
MEKLRRLAKEKPGLDREVLMDDGPAVDDCVEALELWRIVETLPSELGHPVLLRYRVGMTSAEAAKRLEVAPRIIDQQTFKARAVLRKRLRRDYSPGAA